MNVPRSKNRRIYILLLLAVLIGVVSNHLNIRSTENGPLLVIDEKEFDVLGEIDMEWTALITDCSNVSSPQFNEWIYHEAIKVVQNYSPPQSRKTHVASVWQQDSWLLVETEFDELLPSVVPLKQSNGVFNIVPQAVWSGYTTPWKATPFIRKYIKNQAPELPSDLINCFRPQSRRFQ
jgi:hypothetical protein